MLHQSRLFIIIFAILSIFSNLTCFAQSESKWYTIQAGSYLVRSDADKMFSILTKELPPSLHDNLRIEHISSFYSVRVGKFKNQQEVDPLLAHVKKTVSSPMVMLAYIKKERIVRKSIPIDSKTSSEAKSWITKFTSSPQKKPAAKKLVKKIEPVAPKLPALNTAKKNTYEQSKEAKPVDQKQLFFTVQMASYNNERDASLFYKELGQKLPPKALDKLRVEKIGSFFTVRLGRASNRHDLLPVFNQARTFSKRPAIVQAYFITDRIIHLYGSGTISSQPSKENTITQSTASLPLSPKQQIAKKEKTLPDTPPVEDTPVAEIVVKALEEKDQQQVSAVTKLKTDVQTSPKAVSAPQTTDRPEPVNEAKIKDSQQQAKQFAKDTTKPEELYYTIQMASYFKEDDANAFFDTLTNSLPFELRGHLRVEKIGSFFTVRLGKSPKRQQVTSLLKQVKHHTKKPSIVHAYYRQNRISKLYNIDKEAEQNTLTKSLPEDILGQESPRFPEEKITKIAPLVKAEKQNQIPTQETEITISTKKLTADLEPIKPVVTESRKTPQKSKAMTAGKPVKQGQSANKKVKKAEEELFYTIQMASYNSEDDANAFYDILASRLPIELRDHLRVEIIGSFFTVRLGKISQRQQVTSLFDQVKQHTSSPSIVHAYYRQNRISKLYDTGNIEKQSSLKVSLPKDTVEQKSPESAEEIISQNAPKAKTEKITQIPVQEAEAKLTTKELTTQLEPVKPAVAVPRKTPQQSKAMKVGNPVTQVQPVKQKVQKVEEELFYTIQMASYYKEADANSFFDTLANRLPVEFRNHLRVEKVGSFFTVRLGKSSQRQQIIPAFAETKSFAPNPSIVHAYYRTKRIRKQYDSSFVAETKKPDTISHQPVASKPSTEIMLSDKTDSMTVLEQDADFSKPKQKLLKPTIISERDKKYNQSTVIEEDLLLEEKTHSATLTEAENTNNIAKTTRYKEIASRVAKKTTLSESPAATPKELEKRLLAKYFGDVSSPHEKDPQIYATNDSFPKSTDCLTSGCHKGLKDQAVSHYPIPSARCKACHQQQNNNHPTQSGKDFILASDGASLCSQCHASFTGGTLHSPVAEGECLQCHNPHGSPNPALLPVGQNGQEKLCLKCHDTAVVENNYQHGPVGLGACTYCHDPHVSNNTALLRSDPEELCLSCHTDTAKGLAEAPHVHSVVTSQGCSSCHNPHGSQYPGLLNQQGELFCLSCHQDIADKYNKSRFKHDGLYNEKKCGSCHFAHYSENEYLLNKKQVTLCLDCHGATQASDRQSRDIEVELKNSYVHKPVDEGNCALCHDPHGSDYAKLLKGTYPGTFYAPYDPGIYALCFQCHDAELLTMPETDLFTNFRNGSTNLHYTHVALARKGRTCQACHQSHASDGPKLINKTGAAFGAWQMSIEFSTTSTGGSCMPGCHREMGYDRNSPEDYSIKEVDYGKYHIDYTSPN